MFTLSGDVFSVVKDDSLLLRLRGGGSVWKHRCRLMPAGQGQVHPPPDAEATSGCIRRQQHRGWGCSSPLCAPVTRPLHLQPYEHGRCLNTSCCLKPTWESDAWIGTRGVLSCRAEHRGVKSNKSCGWEWVRLFSCVNILRCFLVVLLCVSSVRTFFLNYNKRLFYRNYDLF